VEEDSNQSPTEDLALTVGEPLAEEDLLVEVVPLEDYSEVKTVMMTISLAISVELKVPWMFNTAMDVTEISGFRKRTHLRQSSTTSGTCQQLRNNQFSLLKLMVITNTVYQRKKCASLLKQEIDSCSAQVEVLIPSKNSLACSNYPLKMKTSNRDFQLRRPCFRM
jgi:hypothetical protein